MSDDFERYLGRGLNQLAGTLTPDVGSARARLLETMDTPAVDRQHLASLRADRAGRRLPRVAGRRMVAAAAVLVVLASGAAILAREDDPARVTVAGRAVEVNDRQTLEAERGDSRFALVPLDHDGPPGRLCFLIVALPVGDAGPQDVRCARRDAVAGIEGAAVVSRDGTLRAVGGVVGRDVETIRVPVGDRLEEIEPNDDGFFLALVPSDVDLDSVEAVDGDGHTLGTFKEAGSKPTVISGTVTATGGRADGPEANVVATVRITRNGSEVGRRIVRTPGEFRVVVEPGTYEVTTTFPINSSCGRTPVTVPDSGVVELAFVCQLM